MCWCLKFNETRPTNLNGVIYLIHWQTLVCSEYPWPWCLGNEPMWEFAEKMHREWFVPPFTVHNEKIECCKAQRWMKDWFPRTRAAINFGWKWSGRMHYAPHRWSNDFIRSDITRNMQIHSVEVKSRLVVYQLTVHAVDIVKPYRGKSNF